MSVRANASTRKGMVAVPAGRFSMGSERFYPEEAPVHERGVEGFWIDEHPVTNAEFRRFVKATGYVTVAEQPPDPKDFPDADAGDLVPGSLVFQPTDGPVPLDDWRVWWRWMPGANWRMPGGPASNLNGRDRHPVVQVAYEDALAYAQWAGKELPTEAEWEYASRAGGPPTTYAWGEEPMLKGRVMANTWQGRFPWENVEPLGRHRTTPIGWYPANSWGLVDMIGNVWEWTASPWTPDHAAAAGHPMASHQHEQDNVSDGRDAVDSCCAVSTANGEFGEHARRVIKGGSHLCAPSYCLRYRPPARQGQEVRSSTSHIGFRCVVRDAI